MSSMDDYSQSALEDHDDQHDSDAARLSQVASDDLSEDERPGRFYGPDSSWRYYTKEERALAAYLDQSENNDLSVHLYNAHAWKAQYRGEQRVNDSAAWQSKQNWIKLDEGGKLPFLPPTYWTAWPLKPEDVPRSREQWGAPLVYPDDDKDTFRKVEAWRPSLHLQEELQATFLRVAKERFARRDWSEQNTPHEIKQAPRATIKHSSTSVKAESESDEPDDLIRLEEQMQDDAPSLGARDREHYVPAFWDDDEAANQVLKPTIRHILTKVDHLLVALHKSRQGHRREQSTSRSRSNSRSRSRARSQSIDRMARKRKRNARDVKIHEERMGEQDAATHVDSRASSVSRHYPLGTRDWSEVLGLAALAGWDQSVLDGAARRCAKIFGEGMAMRVQPEAVNSEDDLVTNYVPGMLPPLASIDHDLEELSEDEAHAHSCPYSACVRRELPYDTRWRLREHLKRKHKHTDEVADEVLARVKSAPPTDSEAELEEFDIAVKDGAKHDAARGQLQVQDDFLQPITVPIRRSRDRVKRRSRSTSARPPLARRQRVKPCASCRRQKAKCEKSAPEDDCKRCERLEITCTQEDR